MPPPVGAMGWIDDPWAVNQVLETLPIPILSESSEGRRLTDVRRDGQNVALWELERRHLGQVMRAHYQRRGTCVGQGFSRAVQHLILHEIAAGEIEEWWARVMVASIYGTSRVEIGGGRIGGDGSVGAWAAKAVNEYGVLLRMKYKVGSQSVDLSSDDDDYLCVEWGRNGMPDHLEPEAAKHKVGGISLITTTEMSEAALQNGKMIAICSNRGFTTTRDEYGMCRPSGSWSHCMEKAGVLYIKHPQYPSGRRVIGIWQSWSNSSPDGNDRVTLQTGQEITLPPGVFLIDDEVYERDMLSARDTWGLAGMSGWVPTEQDFVLVS